MVERPCTMLRGHDRGPTFSREDPFDLGAHLETRSWPGPLFTGGVAPIPPLTKGFSCVDPAMMRPPAKLLRAVPTASLMLLTMPGAAVAGPYEDALAAWSRGEYANAYWLWRPLAEQGNADAQFYLGLMNESGQGVPRNDAEAIKWYLKAADQDLAVAQFNLATMYAKGRGVPQNEREAAKWYRLAADQGLGAAQFNLGIMYAEGKGVPHD